MHLSRGRRLNLRERVHIMGVINCTPDSFYGPSRKSQVKSVEQALGMVREGADIIDIGGESTRPGAGYISLEEELDRIIPVIESIRAESDVPLSVDTRKYAVAREALAAGGDIVNDISALEDDDELAPLIARKNCPVVLMHKKGTPLTMQNDPFYKNPVEEICSYLKLRAEYAQEAGISHDKIILDPGIGFGKRLSDNLAILKGIPEIRKLGYPILIGASRKSFVGMILEKAPEDRLFGTLGAHGWSAFMGAEILRVHDVGATADMVRIIEEIQKA